MEIGAIIGLMIGSSKTGSAVSAVVMVLLFLIVSVYPSLPEWTYNLFVLLPSVEVVEIMSSLMDHGKVLVKESIFLIVWLILLTSTITVIGKKRF